MTLRVLFLCTGNSARSLIAEALLRSIGGEAFAVFSAGTHPKGVNPLTLRVLAEAGVEAEGLRSKNVADFLDQPFDYVITVCDSAAEECPVFPGAKAMLHWSFPDPAAVEGPEPVRLTAFRATVRRLKESVAGFIAQAAAPPR